MPRTETEVTEGSVNNGKKFNEVAHLAVGLEKCGFSLHAIKEWRAREMAAGHPSAFADYLRTHGICPACNCYGLRMTGWDPEDELTYWEICPTCGGSGRVPPA
jgi:hypothetical protein